MSADEQASAAVDDLIREAKDRGAILRTGDSARLLLSRHPELAVTLREAAQLIAESAVAAGVPIQFTPLE